MSAQDCSHPMKSRAPTLQGELLQTLQDGLNSASEEVV